MKKKDDTLMVLFGEEPNFQNSNEYTEYSVVEEEILTLEYDPEKGFSICDKI